LRKFVCLFFVLIFMFFNMSTVYCSENVKIYYNKKHITCDVEAFIENSRTLIPVVLLNQMGYTTAWNEKKQTVTITNSDKKIVLTIGSNIAMVDGLAVKMDVKAKILSDRTFVPIRFISENFGYKVIWDGQTRSVYITASVSSTETPDKNSGFDNSQTEKKAIMITNMYTDREDGVLKIKLEADSEINDIERMVLTEPLRYVIDIKNAILDIPQGETEVNSDVISKIRYSQYTNDPYSVRFVVDAKKETSVSYKYKNGFFTISIGDDAKTPYISSITKTELSDGVSFKIKSSRALEYETYKLSNPTRYFVEFEKATVDVGDFKYSGDFVEKVVFDEQADSLRVIFYISGVASASVCDISSSESEYRVTVKKKAVKPSDTKYKSDKLIVIDPGHGGEEPGSVVEEDGKVILYEKDVNLKIAMFAYEKLLKDGYNVIATRTDDTTVSLVKRAEIANNSNADLFISVHNNSFENNSAKGTLTMFAYDTLKEGATITDKELAASIQPHILSATGSQDRDLMENAKIYVLAKTNMPSCLVECLFMSNEEDLKKLMDDTYIKKMGEQIAVGIEKAVSLLEEKDIKIAENQGN